MPRYDKHIMATRLPKLLYHYTDGTGLVAIVGEGKLRLGDTRFVNDRTEHSFASSIIRNSLGIPEDKRDEELLRTTQAIYSFTLAQRRHTIYACSMSETAESISQWQRYGADGYGYCIGFDAAELAKTLMVGEVRTEIRRMIYKKRLQQRAVSNSIDQFRRDEPELARQFRRLGKDWRKFRRFMLAIHLEEVAVVLKNPWFEDEKEWRFIVKLEDSVSEKYARICVRGSYLRPYTEGTCVRTADERQLLPIRKIICGPKLDGVLALDPVRQMTRIRGYSGVDVSQSSLADVWR